MDLSPAGDIPYSYSNPDLVTVTHTHLELSVNFKRHVFEGRAILSIKKKASKCNELVLDTYGLNISDVKKGNFGLIFTHLENPHDDNFGRKLKITLPNVGSEDQGPSSSKKTKVNDNYKIQVIYETSPKSPALYWLEPHQTSDGAHPLLISNSKLTYARAIFPCQDTPSNRTTFYSKITVPKNLNLNVMMTGSRGEIYETADDKVEYTFFSLHKPRAMHEIYIIVGSLRNLQRISRDNVSLDIWAEKKPCDRCGEFLAKIMDILYKIKESYGFLGESVNVCVLPPNVPEFDMQYPDMTFVSSSLLEGQYSIIDTIVQNIIESWIGRIVAIDNFKHLWLIKGLSTFIYRNPKNDEIIDKENKFRRDLQIKTVNNVLNMPQLLNTVSLVPVFTKDLLPIHIIKYVSEKGCLFLNYLQDISGGPGEFTDFLVKKVWLLFEKRQIREATDYFKNLLISHCVDMKKDTRVLSTIEWNKWLNISGFPAKPYTYEKNKTYWQRQADLWIAQETPSFDTIELDQSNDLAIIEFLTYLLTLSTVPDDKLQKIEDEFLRDQNICEIRFLWLRLCIKSEWLDDGRIQEDALKFACSEYCMPKYACSIFRDLYNLAQTRIMAIKSRFMERDNRSKMLPETIKELESILEVKLDGRT